MNRYLAQAISLMFAASSLSMTPAAWAASPTSGVDTSGVDQNVRIQDDFFQHINGGWMKKTEIPADKSSWGSFDELAEHTRDQVRTLVEAIVQKADKPNGSKEQKIADLYLSFMDEAKLEALGLQPLQADFDRIKAINDKKQLPELIAYLSKLGVTAPYSSGVHLDARDSSKYVFDIGQDGLGLPDRDYYLKKNDKQMHDTLVKYQQHIEKMLTLAGDKEAATKAKQIVALETEIAKLQWSRVALRDPVKTYNKFDYAKLDKLTPGYQWRPYLDAMGVSKVVDYVIVDEPDYLQKLDKLVQKTPLETWKTYFSWHLLSGYARYLSKPFADENFAFKGTVLSGAPEQEVRWKRALNLEEEAIGEGLGKLYVEKYFPPENKARMETMVKNLLAAFRASAQTLDWMSPETRKQALAKLDTFTPKIGYPSKWRDYSALTISKDDLVGNVRRANEFETQRNLNKLGKPIDRTEWGMSPQTINAYYNPEMNEIVFPAAILQPPFFNAEADDAVNYGAIGAVIGHEISHGFDDQGAQYDGNGNLRNWWTKEDAKKFKQKTAMLVKQYAAFEPIKGYHVNGELTLGENIADNSGLTIAYKAYKLSLGGKDSPVIDGMTGEQRFYTGFGQVWRGKMRDALMIQLLTANPHAPELARGNGTVVNQDGFYQAFDVKPGDKMYVAPEKRVHIW